MNHTPRPTRVQNISIGVCAVLVTATTTVATAGPALALKTAPTADHATASPATSRGGGPSRFALPGFRRGGGTLQFAVPTPRRGCEASTYGLRKRAAIPTYVLDLERDRLNP